MHGGFSEDFQQRRPPTLFLFTDEEVFQLEGAVNRQNSRYWRAENPTWLVGKHVQTPWVVMWTGTWMEEMVKPYLSPGSVTGQSYIKNVEDAVPSGTGSVPRGEGSLSVNARRSTYPFLPTAGQGTAE